MAPSCTSGSSVPGFSVASFNVRWGYGKDNTPFDLTAVCRDLDADIVALQEVWEPDDAPGQARQAAGALGYELFEAPLSGSNVRAGPRITRHHHEIDGWWGTALLSRFPLRSARTADLGHPGGRVDLAHRQVIVTSIEIGPTPVHLLVAHLSFFWPSTVAQLHRLHRMADGVEEPCVVVGDLNLPPIAVRSVFGPEWRTAVRGRTFPSRRPTVQLDHLLVRGQVLTVEGGGVGPPSGSDHRPISATLSVGQKPDRKP